MAKSLDGATKVNPRYYKGPEPEVYNVLAGNSATWIKGQVGYTGSDGLAVVVGDDPANAEFVFMEDRAAALTATKAKVADINPDTKWIFFVVDGVTDAAATRAMIGSHYSVEVISGVAVLDLDTGTAHSNDIVKVDRLMSDEEPRRHALADEPGQVVGHYIRTASRDVDAA
jgi:hypothetical protein